MTDRHALLIGVPACDADLLPPMRQVVAADIGRMTETLRRSGYQVQHCGADADGEVSTEPSGSRIRAALIRACHDAPAGGVLLLYFSGHGVILDGEGYLVPCDAYAATTDGRPAPESLVPVIPSNIRQCRARLVVFFVDACRQDPAAPLAPQLGGGLLPWLEHGDFALVNSCQAGERSGYSDTGSFFTAALADVLDRRNPARTLHEVFIAVELQMARKAARTEGLTQRPEMALATGRTGRTSPGDVVICEGDEVTEAWRRAVEDTPLWRHTGDGVHRERVRSALVGVVQECARQWQEAQEFLVDRAGVVDAWSAPDYPARVLSEVDACLPAGATLDATELGMLIGAPFLRELALAAGLREAAGIDPTGFDRTYHDGPRADLEITHAMHEHVCRRADGLGRRGQRDARDALAMWLVHRWLGARIAIWEAPAVQEICGRLGAALAATPAADATENELSTMLRVLARGVGADAEDALLLERLGRTDFGTRSRTLAGLLWLGGVMAADPRRMPSVVVDHLGTGSELQLTALHAATLRLRWERVRDVAELHAVCDHPALHQALVDVAQRADRVRSTVAALALDHRLASGLPARLTPDGLRPEHHDGTPAYETPLLHFRLSDEKVRELLMGRQLYGEPELAIRELYQNALDACRYRDARRRYRERAGGTVADWAGGITFVQDVDPAGREYLECRDNGVGMTVETLKNTFANAGERFVYRQDFRQEQAHWQAQDPPIRLIPNSQFGIGVFSYFMIAEEIMITTRAVSVDDVPSPEAHSVRIASSGSLFRITPSTEMQGGGTAVRLYLTGEGRISALQTMRRLLWIAEHAVEVTERGAGRETWAPEKLRYPDATAEPLHPCPDLWWVTGEGGLAADGIRTSEEAYGFVVNLRDKRRPQFTVDRNRLRSWDKAWVREQIRLSVPTLATWSGLSLAWLWSVTGQTPLIAQEVFEHLIADDRRLPVEGAAGGAVEIPLRRAGCLPLDRELFSGEMQSWYGLDRWIVAWRRAVWRGIAPAFGPRSVAEAADVTGFPTVEPLDADVLTAVYDGAWISRRSRLGAPQPDDLLRVAAHEDQPAADRLRRLRRYAITGLDLRAGRWIPAPVRALKREDHPLLPALAAWAPGEPSGTALGAPVARASFDTGMPVAEVLHRATAIAPPDWVPPAVDLAALGDYTFKLADIQLLSRGLDGLPPWVGPVIPPTHVVRASAHLGRSVRDVLGMLDRFASLGLAVAGRDGYPEELTAVEREALWHVPALGTALTALHLFVVAGRVRSRVDAVYDGLGRLAAAGFLRLPDIRRIAGVVPNEDEMTLVNDNLYAYTRPDRARELASGWRAFVRVAENLERFVYGDERDAASRYRNLIAAVRPERSIGAPGVLELTYWLGRTASETSAFLDMLCDDGDVLVDPAIANLDPDRRVRWEESWALFGVLWGGLQRRRDDDWDLRPGSVVSAAAYFRRPLARYLDRLEPYRAHGAPLPDLDDATRRDYEELVPDQHDVELLTTMDEDGDERHVDRIDAFWLVKMAGRFGWTVAQTHQRYARLAPLGVTLDYPPGACPDELVHWQDVLVLTAHLDGSEPVVASPVSESHLTTAAAEIGETPDQVRARIRRYAPLLDLRFKGEPDA